MDTAAYLSRQGWRGNGHALHHTGRGIKKPIHIPQKANVYGIGKKQHDVHADQWWARAFDDTLKGLNTTKNEATGNAEGISLGAGAQALASVGKVGARWAGQGGLYSNFVKGEGLGGTLTPKEAISPAEHDREVLGVIGEGLDSRPAESPRRIKQRKQREEGRIINESELLPSAVPMLDTQESVSMKLHVETKEGRRLKRKEKRLRRALRSGDADQILPQESVLSNDCVKNDNRRDEDFDNKATSAAEEEIGVRSGTAKQSKQKKKKSRKHENG
ncbi:hypothetical protein ACLMJK_008363 [Lecanora helva]